MKAIEIAAACLARDRRELRGGRKGQAEVVLGRGHSDYALVSFWGFMFDQIGRSSV